MKSIHTCLERQGEETLFCIIGFMSQYSTYTIRRCITGQEKWFVDIIMCQDWGFPWKFLCHAECSFLVSTPSEDMTFLQQLVQWLKDRSQFGQESKVEGQHAQELLYLCDVCGCWWLKNYSYPLIQGSQSILADPMTYVFHRSNAEIALVLVKT